MSGSDFRSLFSEKPRKSWQSGLGPSGGSWRVSAASLADDAVDDDRFGAFQQAWKSGASDIDLFGDNPFELGGSVGAGNSANRRADVAKVETFLGRTGHYEPLKDGPSGYISNRLDESIRGFQADNGLDADGILKPGGPTIATLAKTIDGREKPKAVFKTMEYRQPDASVPKERGGIADIMVQRHPPATNEEAGDIMVQRHEPNLEDIVHLYSSGRGEASGRRSASNAVPDRSPFGKGSLLRLADSGTIMSDAAPAPGVPTSRGTPMTEGGSSTMTGAVPTGPGNRPSPFHSGTDAGSERFERFLEHLWPREGGFTNRRQDGKTNHGVRENILDTYQDERGGVGPDGGRVKIEDLTQDQAGMVYKNEFYDGGRLGEVKDEKIAEHIFDMRVNHGGPNAGILVQEAINQTMPEANLKVDGVIGSKTIDAINQATPEQLDALNEKLVDLRKSLYEGSMQKNPDNAEFGGGWDARAESFRPTNEPQP